MINAMMIAVGAAVFFTGFLTGLNFPDFKSRETAAKVKCEGTVIRNKENHNFLNYDGTEQIN